MKVHNCLSCGHNCNDHWYLASYHFTLLKSLCVDGTLVAGLASYPCLIACNHGLHNTSTFTLRCWHGPTPHPTQLAGKFLYGNCREVQVGALLLRERTQFLPATRKKCLTMPFCLWWSQISSLYATSSHGNGAKLWLVMTESLSRDHCACVWEFYFVNSREFWLKCISRWDAERHVCNNIIKG